MKPKEQTAVLSTLLNLVLTVCKFIIFFMTGSLAVLAEAWHSLTDIVTSLMVFFSVRAKRPAPPPQKAGFSGWEWLPLEIKISLFIGIFILAAGVMVVRKIIISPPTDISSPLIPGIFFLIFAVGSYFIYRFESRMGKKLGSPALIADGLHSKADMVGSLIAGFALILLRLGIKADKPAAIIISFFILSFALDTFINFFRALKGEQDWDDRATLGLVCRFFSPSSWEKLTGSSGQSGWGWLTPRRLQIGRRIFFPLIFLGLTILLLANCIFVVGPSQKAIRERLGVPLDRKQPLGPGLYWKLPPPLERVILVDAYTIRSLNIGNVNVPQSVALLWTRQHGSEEAFLSGDNNFFYPYFILHYRVKDPFAYIYGHDRPEAAMKNVADRLITEIFARHTFYAIATSDRRLIEEKIAVSLQEKMDQAGTGLEVVSVNTKDIHPPVSIAGSFEEVIGAIQEKARYVNQALGNKNSIIPEARGQAARELGAARSYVKTKVDTAWGDTGKFTLLRQAFEKEPSLVEQIFYLRGIREALAGKKIILVSPQVGVPDLWLGAKDRFPMFNSANLENEF